MRPYMSRAVSEALRPVRLTRSSTSAEEHTTSWLDIVDMIAASTAARTKPATSGWKKICDRSRKTVSGSSICLAGSGPLKYAMPMRAVVIAPSAVMIIHVVLTMRP